VGGVSEAYPGYDVLAKRDGPSWNDATRRAIDRRLAVRMLPRFFNPGEWETLCALCARIMPQPPDRPPVPLPAFVDAKLADNQLDGFRYHQLPEQSEAWRRGLAALDVEAQSRRGDRFHRLNASDQDDLLGRMQRGELCCAEWEGMPSDVFFLRRVLPDVVHPYYAHPTAWNEIGFGGPASPRGYVRLASDRRDPWEAASAEKVGPARARRRNAHVR
jgi:hypothetical protein